RGRSSRMSAFTRLSVRAATARRLPGCRAWALALRVSAVESRRAAEAFVDSVLPAVFCIDVDLAAVNEREQSGHPLPHADECLALRLLKIRGSSIKFPAAGLSEPLFLPELAQTKDRLAAITQGRLQYLRQEYHRDPTFARAVRHAEHPDALANTTRTRAVV